MTFFLYKEEKQLNRTVWNSHCIIFVFCVDGLQFVEQKSFESSLLKILERKQALEHGFTLEKSGVVVVAAAVVVLFKLACWMK